MSKLLTVFFTASLGLLLMACKLYAVEPVHSLEKVEKVEYVTNINFRIHPRDVTGNPQLLDAFTRAIAYWASKVPIHPNVMILSPANKHMNNLIDIRFAKLAEDFGYPESVMGFFDPASLTIFVDTLYEDRPDLAYLVFVHEIGHVFGLSHIVDSQFDGLRTGYIIVEDAEKYLMYPSMAETNSHGELSQFEIDLATEYIRKELTTPGAFYE